MSKSKRIARTVVAENQIEEVTNAVVAPEVIGTVIEEIDVDDSINPAEFEVATPVVAETLIEKINRIKAEQAATLAALQLQKKELDEKVKAMKAEEIALKAAQKEEAAKERFEKLAAKLNRPEDSKKNAIINAILDGAVDAEAVVEITGFDAKLVSDTIWGLEKAVGLR